MLKYRAHLTKYTHINLKEICVSKGFTQNQMAEKMTMEQTTYSKKERGISPINENEWKRLSEIFETPIDVLKKALPRLVNGLRAA